MRISESVTKGMDALVVASQSTGLDNGTLGILRRSERDPISGLMKTTVQNNAQSATTTLVGTWLNIVEISLNESGKPQLRNWRQRRNQKDTPPKITDALPKNTETN